MDLAKLKARKVELEGSLKNMEQSYHVISGHLAEVNYQISEVLKVEVKVDDENVVDSNAELPIE